jgi:hypothetical protein
MIKTNKKIPIRVRRSSIADPNDIKEYDSIHAAMRKHNKAFKTIKTYITERKVVDGYLWEIPVVEDMQRIESLTEPDIDLAKSETNSVLSEAEVSSQIDLLDHFIEDHEDNEDYMHPIIIEPLVIYPLDKIPEIVEKNPLQKREPCLCSLM